MPKAGPDWWKAEISQNLWCGSVSLSETVSAIDTRHSNSELEPKINNDHRQTVDTFTHRDHTQLV